jgi:L-alanine-DL-glutamate epimerase-like enolase superfamily enzyme
MSSNDLRLDRFEFRELRIPFKMAFRHAAAERSATETAWIDAVTTDGAIGSGESCPRPYVTGETLASARAFVLRHQPSIRQSITGLDALRAWVSEHEAEIDANPAAWCAVELAILDLLGKHHTVPLEALLSLPPLVAQQFRYSAVLGDASATTFHAMAERYRLAGFTDFKVKLSGNVERDRDKMAVFDGWPGAAVRVRADANNLWLDADAAIAGLRAIGYPFTAIEEPIGANRYAELARVGDALDCAIVLDESFTRREQLALLSEPRSRWLINVRVSKMGGVLRSLAVINGARALGVGAIVGAQVGETSLLTRAALAVASAAGEALVAQEGAFGTFLLEHDVCDPPLMFGNAGVLDAARHPMLARPGLGVARSAKYRF